MNAKAEETRRALRELDAESAAIWRRLKAIAEEAEEIKAKCEHVWIDHSDDYCDYECCDVCGAIGLIKYYECRDSDEVD